MILSPNNPEFQQFGENVRARIAELKDELAGPLDLDQTNRTRGAIAELQRIVDEAAPTASEVSPSYNS